ncbi:hypothetical protein Dimus_009185 [Dionaea muscipula]
MSDAKPGTSLPRAGCVVTWCRVHSCSMWGRSFYPCPWIFLAFSMFVLIRDPKALKCSRTLALTDISRSALVLSSKCSIAAFSVQHKSNMYGEYPSQAVVKAFLFRERLTKKLPMTMPEMAMLQLILMGSNTHNLLMFTVSMLKLTCRLLKRAKKRARKRSIEEKKKTVAAIKKRRNLKKEKFIKTKAGHIKGVIMRRRPMSLTKNKREGNENKVPRETVFRYVAGGVHDRACLGLIHLSHRYIEVNSEWEFWTICLMSQVCKYDRSILFGNGVLQVEHFKMIAKKLKISVVPAVLFERLDSSGYCSPPPRNLITVRMKKSKGRRYGNLLLISPGCWIYMPAIWNSFFEYLSICSSPLYAILEMEGRQCKRHCSTF